MEPLDLRRTAPRAPRTPLGDLDLIMAARSVDKLRATLPGGDLGAYQIAGFTARFMETLGIDEEDFRSIVALAANDQEIAAWLRKHCSQAQFDECTRLITSRLLRDRINDDDFVQKYPHARALPLEMPIVDMLPLDDELAFGVR